MKRIIFSSLLIAVFAFSACEKSSVNAPEDADSRAAFLKAVENLDLSTDQLAQVDEMFYLDEEMSAIMNPKQEENLSTLANGVSPIGIQDERRDRRHALDMAALIYYRLIIRANPDLAEETKLALRELIATSNQTRLQLIRENIGNPELLRQLLAAEHQALIEAMNALLTAEQLTKVQELKDKIEQERKDRRDKWIEHRINFHVAMMTRYLGLSPEQADAIKTILLEQYEQIKVLREQYKDDPEGFRNALKDLHDRTQELIANQLTAEQLEKWNNRHKHGGGVIHPRR